jgi:hypothetical protein
MQIELPINDGDDPAFVRCVGRLLARDVLTAQPEQVYVLRIDNWFGDRWYGFRGKSHGAAGFRNKPGWKKRFIVPPFVPERVLSETCYERTGEGGYARTESARPAAVHQKGGDNLKRWLDRFTESGLMLWYSGNSASQDMASAMLYVNTPAVTDAWYLGVRRNEQQWQFHKGIGMTIRDLEACDAANTA